MHRPAFKLKAKGTGVSMQSGVGPLRLAQRLFEAKLI